jgi:hypothetical protein
MLIECDECGEPCAEEVGCESCDCCEQPELIDCPRCGEEVCKNCGDCCDREDMGWAGWGRL